jgi:hypothetical protein
MIPCPLTYFGNPMFISYFQYITNTEKGATNLYKIRINK